MKSERMGTRMAALGRSETVTRKINERQLHIALQPVA